MKPENSTDNMSTTGMNADGRNRLWSRGFLKFPRSWQEVKRKGWKFVLAFVLFYLIRDSLLYLLLPYLVYKGIISF
jgi:hypothetical protein